MATISFRPATQEDVDVLRKVKISAFADEFREFKYAEYQDFQQAVEECDVNHADDGMFSRGWHELFCSFGDWTLVIQDGANVIGSISALPGNYSGASYPGIELSNEVNVLLCIYILPEYKNKGVGSQAMRYMEQLHPSEKWMLDTPDISAKNKYFYQKCGYTPGIDVGPERVFTKGM